MKSSFLSQITGTWVLFLGLCVYAGCSSADGGMGATPGGAQDNDLANEKVNRGVVPAESDITVEGILATHDLPLQGSPCEKALCVNSAYAVAPTLDYESSTVFVQMGLSSNVNESTFKRAPLNLAVVVDRSGSMAGEKIIAVRYALTKLIDLLGEQDRLSIVLFDQVAEVLVESQPVTDRAALQAKVRSIKERGSTDLALGLRYGIEQIKDSTSDPKQSKRVMVLTDANTNTGETDTSSFVELASSAAQDNIGLSVFGVGVDLNQDLVLSISRIRGGNYFYLANAEKISTVFDQNFDYLVTPIAYDLSFKLTPATGYRVSAVYGLASAPFGQSSVELNVPTVFLSRNHGAIVARLAPTGAWPSGSSPISELTLSYTPADGTEKSTERQETIYEGSDTLGNQCRFYSQVGVRRTVAYVNAALAEKQACGLYHQGKTTQAKALLDKAEDLLLEEAAATEDSGLEAEAQVVTALRSNMGVDEIKTASPSTYRETDQDEEWVGPCTMSKNPGRPSQSPTLALNLVAIAAALLCQRRKGNRGNSVLSPRSRTALRNT